MSEKRLVPSPSTQFPGSFAPNLREDSRKSAKSRALRSILYNYFTDGWNDISVWKSAFIEFVGTTSLVYLSAMIHTTIGSFNTLQAAPYVGITNIFLISLFIWAMAPSTGGHTNPLITFSTMVTGLTGFCRGTLYLIGQTAGAALGGGLIRGSYGRNLTQLYQGGGCFFEPELIDQGQVYLIESVMSFILLFIAFGVGLDPRQAQVMGPKLGPFLVGSALGLTTFATVGIAAGYGGANMNPARCFSYAVARQDFKCKLFSLEFPEWKHKLIRNGNVDQWVWWIGPLTGSLFHATVYHIAPPWHRAETLGRAHASNHA
ncbi:Aquaporin PIP-type [Hyphodiscus hymeniophilus]|uniref:Aquaporin PIP-type n=1 Tax=Hyphodiscus hymeniophilus TaxID=353542 RepID=A0A9P6SK03_9HELO|nr:Aquaporin PIP-type [Hyphodiscus hymeniophilus]